MATAKRELTDTRVQGHLDTITLDEARVRLSGTRRDVIEFLRSHNISHLRVGDDVAIDAAEFERALRVVVESDTNDIRKAARNLVERTRAEQGLPPKIKDPAVIGHVVALLQPVVDD